MQKQEVEGFFFSKESGNTFTKPLLNYKTIISNPYTIILLLEICLFDVMIINCLQNINEYGFSIKQIL